MGAAPGLIFQQQAKCQRSTVAKPRQKVRPRLQSEGRAFSSFRFRGLFSPVQGALALWHFSTLKPGGGLKPRESVCSPSPGLLFFLQAQLVTLQHCAWHLHGEPMLRVWRELQGHIAHAGLLQHKERPPRKTQEQVGLGRCACLCTVPALSRPIAG